MESDYYVLEGEEESRCDRRGENDEKRGDDVVDSAERSRKGVAEGDDEGGRHSTRDDMRMTMMAKAGLTSCAMMGQMAAGRCLKKASC